MTTETPIPWRTAYLLIAAAASSGLPTPLEVGRNRHNRTGDQMLNIDLARHDELRAWAEHLGLRVDSHLLAARTGDELGIHAHGDWRGWYVQMSAWEPATPDSTLSTVDAVAAVAIRAALAEVTG